MRDNASTGYLWCVFAVILCLNTPFIVCDFVFAGRGGCVDDKVDGFSNLTLATWLRVDGGCRAAVAGLFLLCALISCFNFEAALRMLICTFLLLILYSFFALAWYIVGAVLFWGNLDKSGECSGSVKGYMYALLILGFLGVCANCFSGNQQRQQNHWSESNLYV